MLCNFSGPVLIRVLPPLLVTEFVLGLAGNGFAIFIFCFRLRPWKSSTVLLFNLAIADIMLIMTLPFRASYYMSKINWLFGETICNVSLFMLAMNRSGSTFFLMAIAVDRYIRVVHPYHPINSLSVGKAMLGAVALWLIPIAMTGHVFSLQHVNTTYCESFMVDTTSRGNLSWHKFAFLFFFYMPLLVILYCTFHIIRRLRRRQLTNQAKFKKALYLIVVVMVLFIVCFLPSNITLVTIWIKMALGFVCDDVEQLTTVFYITISLTYLNSVLDPVVYYFSSPAFKNICRRTLQLPQTETCESTEMRRHAIVSLTRRQLGSRVNKS